MRAQIKMGPKTYLQWSSELVFTLALQFSYSSTHCLYIRGS